MDDDAHLLPVTPPNAGEAEDNDDLESIVSFNFEEPAAAAPEGAYFEDYAAAPERSRMPQHIREIGILLNKKRRAATQATVKGAATAWIDQDDSGTYDPKRKRATPPDCQPKKVKKQRTAAEFDEDGNPKPRRQYRAVGYGFLMTFSFKTEKAGNYLRSITPGPFNSQSTNADDELSDSSTDFDSSYGSFPKRRRKKQLKRLGDLSTRADGLTIDQLTAGHPQRRGCKACFEIGDDDCTLIGHGFDYPCQACEDAEIDCELIIPPELKKSCERCKKKRRSCSYHENGGRGVDTCEVCEEEGVTCCAGPLKGSSYSRKHDSTVSRSNATQQPSVPALTNPAQERMYVSCNQCRDGGKRCSLKNKQSFGPCTCCRKINEQCKFVLPQRRAHPLQAPISFTQGKKTKTKASRKSRTREDSTTPPPLRKRIGNPHTPNTHSRTLFTEAINRYSKKNEKALKKGRSLSYSTSSKSWSRSVFTEEPELIGDTLGQRHTHKITAFCHPIKFNYEPDPMGKEPCSWCESPFFGLYGLADESGPRKVEGFYWPDGSGFEEVQGGWSEAGFSQSKMCVGCTFERIRIVGCEIHHIRPLSIVNGEFDPRVWDDKAWGDAAEALKRDDDQGGSLILKAKWCSICPNLAGFKCASKQDFDLCGGEEGDEGCGLLLCNECRDLMGKCVNAGIRKGGQALDAMINEVTRNKLLYLGGVRADAEFLTSEGELMVRVGGAGVVEDEDEDEVVEIQRGDWKGKGRGLSMFEPPYNNPPISNPPRASIDPKDSRDNGKGKELTSSVAEGWMNGGSENRELCFGGKIEADVAAQMGSALGGVKPRKAMNFGEEVEASGKGKEKSRYLGAEVEVEVIELSDDEE